MEAHERQLAKLVREALLFSDEHGLTDVSIKLNDALVILDGLGLPAPEPRDEAED